MQEEQGHRREVGERRHDLHDVEDRRDDRRNRSLRPARIPSGMPMTQRDRATAASDQRQRRHAPSQSPRTPSDGEPGDRQQRPAASRRTRRPSAPATADDARPAERRERRRQNVPTSAPMPARMRRRRSTKTSVVAVRVDPVADLVERSGTAARRRRAGASTGRAKTRYRSAATAIATNRPEERAWRPSAGARRRDGGDGRRRSRVDLGRRPADAARICARSTTPSERAVLDDADRLVGRGRGVEARRG